MNWPLPIDKFWYDTVEKLSAPFYYGDAYCHFFGIYTFTSGVLIFIYFYYWYAFYVDPDAALWYRTAIEDAFYDSFGINYSYKRQPGFIGISAVITLFFYLMDRFCVVMNAFNPDINDAGDPTLPFEFWFSIEGVLGYPVFKWCFNLALLVTIWLFISLCHKNFIRLIASHYYYYETPRGKKKLIPQKLWLVRVLIKLALFSNNFLDNFGVYTNADHLDLSEWTCRILGFFLICYLLFEAHVVPNEVTGCLQFEFYITAYAVIFVDLFMDFILPWINWDYWELKFQVWVFLSDFGVTISFNYDDYRIFSKFPWIKDFINDYVLVYLADPCIFYLKVLAIWIILIVMLLIFSLIFCSIETGPHRFSNRLFYRHRDGFEER